MFITVALAAAALFSLAIIGWLALREAAPDESARFRRASDLTRRWAESDPPQSADSAAERSVDGT